jgi:hypothetical protein
MWIFVTKRLLTAVQSEQIAIPYEMSLDRPKGNAKRHRIPLGTSRILKSKHITDGGCAMETHLSFSCTLEQIAAGAYLTASDASFALAELGLQKYITEFNQDDAASSPKTASGSNANGPSGSGEVEASQATLSTFGPPLDEVYPGGAHDQPPTETVASSARELRTTVTEPEVPILTRDFIRLLGEKASFRRKPINKEFVLLWRKMLLHSIILLASVYTSSAHAAVVSYLFICAYIYVYPYNRATPIIWKRYHHFTETLITNISDDGLDKVTREILNRASLEWIRHLNPYLSLAILSVIRGIAKLAHRAALYLNGMITSPSLWSTMRMQRRATCLEPRQLHYRE